MASQMICTSSDVISSKGTIGWNAVNEEYWAAVGAALVAALGAGVAVVVAVSSGGVGEVAFAV